MAKYFSLYSRSRLVIFLGIFFYCCGIIILIRKQENHTIKAYSKALGQVKGSYLSNAFFDTSVAVLPSPGNNNHNNNHNNNNNLSRKRVAVSYAKAPTRLWNISDSDIKQWKEHFLRSRKLALSDPQFDRHLLELFVLEQHSEGDNEIREFHAQNQSQPNDSVRTGANLTNHTPQGPRMKVGRLNGLVEFLDPALCEPLSPEVLLYNRIFKTGSTSMSFLIEFMSKMMDFVSTSRTTEDFYNTGNSEPYPKVIEYAASKHWRHHILLTGHFFFRKNLKIQRSHAYINQVREPVARFVSHYAYMHSAKDRPTDRVKEMIESGEINETIEQCIDKQGQGCKNNVMTRFFCGPEPFCKNGSRKALEKAKKNISKYYIAVGLLEHVNLYLEILHKRLPYFFAFVPTMADYKQKVGPKFNVSAVPKQVIERIKQANKADIELYEFIEQLSWRQVRACGITE